MILEHDGTTKATASATLRRICGVVRILEYRGIESGIESVYPSGHCWSADTSVAARRADISRHHHLCMAWTDTISPVGAVARVHRGCGSQHWGAVHAVGLCKCLVTLWCWLPDAPYHFTGRWVDSGVPRNTHTRAPQGIMMQLSTSACTRVPEILSDAGAAHVRQQTRSF